MSHLFLECAVRGALLIAGTAITLYALRVKNAAAKHTIWTGVLALMLLLPVWTAWGPKAALRLLPPVPEKTTGQLIEPSTVISIPAPVLQSNTPLPEISQPPTARPLPITWQDAALGIYLLGLCMLLLRLAIGTVRARKLIRHAQLRDGKQTSSMCAAPVTVGFINPTVILPDHWTAWPQAQLDAVLTHENEHARRRDPLVQWLALLNRAVFWFHPAAWWLERELSTLAEQACDDVVLSRGHNPREYAECLIDVARSVMRSQARLNIAGMAMPGSSLPQRIRQIIERGPAPRISRARMAAVVAACAITGTLFAAVTLDHAKLTAYVQTAKLQTAPAASAQVPTKFVLGDLQIDGEVHERDALRDRILKAWKDREYADANQLADEVMHNGVRDDFQRRGYFTVVAVDRVAQPLDLTDGKQRIRVIVPVTEGDQFRLGTLAIQNYDQNRPLTISASNLRDSLRSGDLLNVDEIRKGIEELTSAYASAGYSDVTVVPNFNVDHLHHRVDMTLRIIEGPHTSQGQPVIERIEFEGNRRMRSETLASLIFTRPGDPYNKGVLSRDFQALLNTQNFENIRLDVQDSPDRPNGKIVIFHLVERPMIRRIEYLGIKSLSQSEILDRFKQRDVRLSVESQLNPTTIKNAGVAIKQLLSEHGHPLAVVRSNFEQIPATNAVKLTITVDEDPSVPPPPSFPTFDTVSIKRHDAGGPQVRLQLLSGGRLVGTSVTVPVLVRFAYQLRLFRLLVGGPDWIRSDHFDVEASAEGNTSSDQSRLMVQSLLADRFKLSVHWESRQLPIYALIVTKGGSLPPSDATKCVTSSAGPSPAGSGVASPLPNCGTLLGSPIKNGLHQTGRSITIPDLIRQLDGFLDRVVVDRTNLNGTYDVELEFAPQRSLTADAADPSAPPSIFTAVQKQLGLELVPQTEPVDVLVIDHVEQPSDN